VAEHRAGIPLWALLGNCAFSNGEPSWLSQQYGSCTNPPVRSMSRPALQIHCNASHFFKSFDRREMQSNCVSIGKFPCSIRWSQSLPMCRAFHCHQHRNMIVNDWLIISDTPPFRPRNEISLRHMGPRSRAVEPIFAAVQIVFLHYHQNIPTKRTNLQGLICTVKGTFNFTHQSHDLQRLQTISMTPRG
jgi:hypothetical protein